MLTVELEKIYRLHAMVTELRIISHLQLLVDTENIAKDLDVSNNMKVLAAEYLIEANARTVESLCALINEENFTVPIRVKK